MALLIVCWVGASWKRLLHVLLQVSLARARGHRSQTCRESTPSTRGAQGKAPAFTLAWPGIWDETALSVPKNGCIDISCQSYFSLFFLCRVIGSKHLSWLSNRQENQIPCVKGSSWWWGGYEGIRSFKK